MARPTATDVRTALDVLLWLSQQPETHGRTRDEIGHVRSLLWERHDAAWETAQPAGPDGMECLAISDDKRFACTRVFGHDGEHVAHGPRGRVIETWERKATDRFGSEAE